MRHLVKLIDSFPTSQYRGVKQNSALWYLVCIWAFYIYICIKYPCHCVLSTTSWVELSVPQVSSLLCLPYFLTVPCFKSRGLLYM